MLSKKLSKRVKKFYSKNRANFVKNFDILKFGWVGYLFYIKSVKNILKRKKCPHFEHKKPKFLI